MTKPLSRKRSLKIAQRLPSKQLSPEFLSRIGFKEVDKEFAENGKDVLIEYHAIYNRSIEDALEAKDFFHIWGDKGNTESFATSRYTDKLGENYGKLYISVVVLKKN
ncbi:hypothetical protein [Poseidonibacter ostreae]|uniref:Uncharacterized protein n=1 Tax=Poseidonibacter ostreae TaxID=2654171 RepID=A0A6L4WWZ5_9BACT|nr:hypothetical protein [Poseidonibacter ostreae]KAB7891397.1 hypothetical protein GBG19_00745 [Poseidonibacter ostreae]